MTDTEVSMRKLSSACTLDCFDCCKLNVYVENGQVVKVEGDKDHPYTRGMICHKGKAHLTRHSHKERQYMPLKKVEGVWQEISFDEALDTMAGKLAEYKRTSGSQSVMYYEQYGSGSVLKSIGEIFFQFYGGCAKQKGGPCWSAGIQAQKQNFGDVKSHSLEDMLNSKTIVIWGKNLAETTIHTMQMVKRAQKKGIHVVVIDPIETLTAKQADEYIRVRPGGDGALALAMTRRILEQGREDRAYIEANVEGAAAYENYVLALDLGMLCEEAGVSIEMVDRLVEWYTNKPATILLGYGLQKYAYGGNTIRLIDTLAAITGQIGISGGGVNYANRVFPSVLAGDPYNSGAKAENKEFYVSEIATFLKEQNIKMAVIVKSNLLNQLPALDELEEALEQVEFKVCFDQFLTDTAEHCDLFIPTTTVFESEDLIYSSMTNPYLTYIEKAVEPRHPLMDEYAFFQELARRMELTGYPMVTKEEYLSKVIEPLKSWEENMSLSYLKENYFTIHTPVAWEGNRFKTPSGKFEIQFDEAAVTGHRRNEGLRLLTTHSKDTLFSQHMMEKEGYAKVYLNSSVASARDIGQGDLVVLTSKRGEILAEAVIDEAIGDGILMMHVGWWKKHGNPNWILDSGSSDIGGQVTYHENRVEIRKQNESK